MTSSFYVRLVAENRMVGQRVFTFGDTKLYALECIAVVAAIVSGASLAMVNLVIGELP